MTLLLQILQTMLLTAVIICLVWTATSFSKNNTGYRWRKYLWLLLAVRLIIPINFDMPGYNAPINIAVTSEGIKSSNRFSSNEWFNNLSYGFTNTGFNAFHTNTKLLPLSWMLKQIQKNRYLLMPNL